MLTVVKISAPTSVLDGIIQKKIASFLTHSATSVAFLTGIIQKKIARQQRC